MTDELTPDRLSPGDVLAFRTSPFTAFSPPDTGRWAAARVVAVDERIVGLAVLDGVWPQPPTLAQALGCDVLKRRRFAFRGDPTLLGVRREVWRPGELAGLVRIGSAPLSAALVEAGGVIAGFGPGASHGYLDGASTEAEGEWRWAHERETLRAEIDREAEAEAAAEAAREARLEALTWDTLLAEAPLPRWTDGARPPADFTRQARALLEAARRDAFALGERPKKAAVRAVLQACVEALNVADDAFGGVVETAEREDLVEALYEIAVVSGQPGLGEDIDRWRDW